MPAPLSEVQGLALAFLESRADCSDESGGSSTQDCYQLSEISHLDAKGKLKAKEVPNCTA